jgi:hypothetical protein
MTDDNVTELPGNGTEPEVSTTEEMERLSDVLDTVFGQLAEAAVSPDGRGMALGAIRRLNKELERRQAALDEIEGKLNPYKNRAREVVDGIVQSLCRYMVIKQSLDNFDEEERADLYDSWVTWIEKNIEEAVAESEK